MPASLRLVTTAAVLGTAILTGCTGETMQSMIDRPGADRYFQYGASPGEMRAVVVGNPFPVSKAIVDQAVVDAMQRNHHGPMTHFTTQPGPDAHPDFRIVMAFNTPRNFNASGLCRGTDAIPSAKARGDQLQLLSAFCVDDRLYSHAKVSALSVASPSDPRFASMVRTAMWQLVPSQDPFERQDRCKLPNC